MFLGCIRIRVIFPCPPPSPPPLTHSLSLCAPDLANSCAAATPASPPAARFRHRQLPASTASSPPLSRGAAPPSSHLSISTDRGTAGRLLDADDQDAKAVTRATQEGTAVCALAADSGRRCSPASSAGDVIRPAYSRVAQGRGRASTRRIRRPDGLLLPATDSTCRRLSSTSLTYCCSVSPFLVRSAPNPNEARLSCLGWGHRVLLIYVHQLLTDPPDTSIENCLVFCNMKLHVLQFSVANTTNLCNVVMSNLDSDLPSILMQTCVTLHVSRNRSYITTSSICIVGENPSMPHWDSSSHGTATNWRWFTSCTHRCLFCASVLLRIWWYCFLCLLMPKAHDMKTMSSPPGKFFIRVKRAIWFFLFFADTNLPV